MNKIILKKIANSNSNVKTMLIIGPGKSNILKDICNLKTFINIDLVDHNDDALNYQKNLLKNFNSNFKFYNTELSIKQPLSFLNLQYDIIICTEVLEHVRDNYNLLNRIYQLLNQNGLFFVSVPNKYVDNMLLKLNKNYMQNHDENIGHLNFYNKIEFINLLKNANFNIKSFYKIASEYIPFHIILALSNTHIDEDTGEVLKKDFSVLFGITIVRLLKYSK